MSSRNRLNGSLPKPASNSSADQVDVPQDRQFVGFDAYKKPWTA